MLKRLAGLAAVAALTLGAAAPSGVTSQEALGRLKGLTGTWEGTIEGKADKVQVIYRVISGGTAVMETLFPGTPEEMISVYFADGGELRMTHYCAAGNQPHLRLDRRASTPTDLRFAFEGGTNLDPKKDGHIHSGHLFLAAGDRIEAEWDYFQGGKAAGAHKMTFTRAEA
jgi:hypothetical protein